MAFRIERGEPIPHAIARMARAELARAREIIGVERRPLTTRIHELRVSLKKVRALTRMVRPVVGPAARREDRRLRKLARSVSPIRDAQVLLETFTELGAKGGVEARPSLEAALEGRLRERARRLEPSNGLDELARRLRKARRRVERWAPDADDSRAGMSGLIEGYREGYRRARKAMAKAYRVQSGATFHAWRRAVKAHRHQVHVLEAWGPRHLERRLNELDRLDTSLGDEHDLGLLAEALRAEKTCAPDDCARLLDLLARRRRQLRVAARPLGNRLFAVRPRDFVI